MILRYTGVELLTCSLDETKVSLFDNGTMLILSLIVPENPDTILFHSNSPRFFGLQEIYRTFTFYRFYGFEAGFWLVRCSTFESIVEV